MEGIVIKIDWIYFLGIMGSLILIAWYSNGRFTALETSMEWVKNLLRDLDIGSKNLHAPSPAFGSGSPIDLKPTGEQWLVESGLKTYLDEHKVNLLNLCTDKKDTNPYEVQEYIFRLFDTLQLEKDFEDTLKKFAYEKGTSLSVLRRVGAIYLRNLCLEDFSMNKEDIDRHSPNVES